MAILICGILDGIIEKPRKGTIAIAERGMTAVGFTLGNSACLEDETTIKQVRDQYKLINAGYFSAHTMAPLQFGNIVGNAEEVRRFLINATIQLKALMDKVKGKAEIIIQVSFDVQKAIVEISKSADISNKIAVGKAFFELSQKNKTSISQALKSKLSGHVADYVETAKVRETVILHNSYLVEKAKKELFDDALDEIVEKCDDFLIFNYVGPLPPYSFVSSEFNKGKFELINEARLALGLKEQCTFDEVKSSYREISLKVHPDKNEGEDKKMKELNEAYRIVTAYCNSVNESEYSFTKKAIEQSFVHY